MADLPIYAVANSPVASICTCMCLTCSMRGIETLCNDHLCYAPIATGFQY